MTGTGRPIPPRRTNSAANAAATLVLLANDWLRLQSKEGDPPPPERVREALTALALAAPEVALHRKRLMRFLGPQVEYELVSALAASKFDGAECGQADSTVSARQAADLIGCSPQAVRLAAGRGRLTGVKHPVTGEWRIDRAAAQAYRRQRGAKQSAGRQPDGRGAACRS